MHVAQELPTQKEKLCIKYLLQNLLSAIKLRDVISGCHLQHPLGPAQGFLPLCCWSPAQCIQRPGGLHPSSIDVAVAFSLAGSSSSEGQLATTNKVLPSSVCTCGTPRTHMKLSTTSQDLFSFSSSQDRSSWLRVCHFPVPIDSWADAHSWIPPVLTQFTPLST